MDLSQRQPLSERVDTRLGIAAVSVRNHDEELEGPSELASDATPTLSQRGSLSTLHSATVPSATLQSCLDSNPDFPLFLLGLLQKM